MMQNKDAAEIGMLERQVNNYKVPSYLSPRKYLLALEFNKCPRLQHHKLLIQKDFFRKNYKSSGNFTVHKYGLYLAALHYRNFLDPILVQVFYKI